MSISFSSVYVNRIHHLAHVQVCYLRKSRVDEEAHELSKEFDNRWATYHRYVHAYRAGEMRMSELRKQHRNICDFLDYAAKRFPWLDYV